VSAGRSGRQSGKEAALFAQRLELKKQEEEARKRQEEVRKRQDEEERKRQEEVRKRQDEEVRNRQEEERKRQEEVRKKQDEEVRKRQEEVRGLQPGNGPGPKGDACHPSCELLGTPRSCTCFLCKNKAHAPCMEELEVKYRTNGVGGTAVVKPGSSFPMGLLDTEGREVVTCKICKACLCRLEQQREDLLTGLKEEDWDQLAKNVAKCMPYLKVDNNWWTDPETGKHLPSTGEKWAGQVVSTDPANKAGFLFSCGEDKYPISYPDILTFLDIDHPSNQWVMPCLPHKNVAPKVSTFVVACH
jgi:flagellar biosynthesis GTPase FlhF